MKKIKTLKDQSLFTIGKYGRVVYHLDKLDSKNKSATYTSCASGRTFEKNWNLLVTLN